MPKLLRRDAYGVEFYIEIGGKKGEPPEVKVCDLIAEGGRVSHRKGKVRKDRKRRGSNFKKR